MEVVGWTLTGVSKTQAVHEYLRELQIWLENGNTSSEEELCSPKDLIPLTAVGAEEQRKDSSRVRLPETK